MIVKLLTEHHLKFLSLKGGCRGSSESSLVKMSNCWKSHAAAQLFFEEKSYLYWGPIHFYNTYIQAKSYSVFLLVIVLCLDFSLRPEFFYWLIYEPSYCNFLKVGKKLNLISIFFFLFDPPTLNIICFVV